MVGLSLTLELVLHEWNPTQDGLLAKRHVNKLHLGGMVSHATTIGQAHPGDNDRVD